MIFAGLKLECTASIGPAYWHLSQESCTITERAPEYTGWMSGGQYQIVSILIRAIE